MHPVFVTDAVCDYMLDRLQRFCETPDLELSESYAALQYTPEDFDESEENKEFFLEIAEDFFYLVTLYQESGSLNGVLKDKTARQMLNTEAIKIVDPSLLDKPPLFDVLEFDADSRDTVLTVFKEFEKLYDIYLLSLKMDYEEDLDPDDPDQDEDGPVFEFGHELALFLIKQHIHAGFDYFANKPPEPPPSDNDDANNNDDGGDTPSPRYIAGGFTPKFSFGR